MANILPEDKIGIVVRRIQTIYLVLSCLSIFCICGLIFGRSDRALKEEIEPIIGVFVIGMIYLGLRLRQPWVVHLVLIFSPLGVVMNLLFAFEHSVNLTALLCKTLGFFYGVLCAYQIIFFSKKEVKVFFKDRGVTLFG